MSLIEFKHGSGTVVVEVAEQKKAGGDSLAATNKVAEKARQSFDEALSGITPIAKSIMDQVVSLSPESVSVEFGVKFTAQAGIVLASSSLEGHCKITLNWKPKP